MAHFDRRQVGGMSAKQVCQTLVARLYYLSHTLLMHDWKHLRLPKALLATEFPGVAESRYELVRNWNIPEFEIVK